MKCVRAVWYGIPFSVLLIVGGLTALAGDVTGWRWLERLELYLRSIVAEFEQGMGRL